MPRVLSRRSLAALLLLTLCCFPSLAATRLAPMRHNNYDAYRLSNGQVEVIVVPALGRIVHYSLIGEPNRLWDNTTTGRTPPYTHFGGEKIWAWPQSEWGEPSNRKGWPPPGNMDPLPFTAAIEGPKNDPTLHLTSVEPLQSYGVRVHRLIRLAPTGSELTIENRFEQLEDPRPEPFALWSVAQVPVPDLLLARVSKQTTLADGFTMMSPKLFRSIRRLADNQVLLVERTPDASTKLGLDGTLLAAFGHGTLFVNQITRVEPAAAPYAPGDQAQIYSNQDPPPNNPRALPAYIELEFTSPKTNLKRGESSSLTLTWTLHKLPPDQQTPEALASYLLKL